MLMETALILACIVIVMLWSMVRAKDSCPLFRDDKMDMSYEGHKKGEKILANAFEYPDTSAEAAPDGEGAHFAAALTAKIVYIKCNMLKVGDEVTGFNLLGRVTSGGNTVTVDAAFMEVPKAGTPADPTGDASNAITQVSKTAAYTMDENATFTTAETIVTDKTYNIVVTVTTAAGCTAKIHGAELLVNIK